MRIIKENTNTIILCLCEILIGVLLLINPVKFAEGIITLLGIALAAVGIWRIIVHFRMPPETAVRGMNMSFGLVCAAVGIVCILWAEPMTMMFSIITVFYGCVILLSGIAKVQLAVDLARLRRRGWIAAAIGAAAAIAAGLIVIFNPFESTLFVYRFAAVMLIIEAALDVIALFLQKGRN